MSVPSNWAEDSPFEGLAGFKNPDSDSEILMVMQTAYIEKDIDAQLDSREEVHLSSFGDYSNAYRSEIEKTVIDGREIAYATYDLDLTDAGSASAFFILIKGPDNGFEIYLNGDSIDPEILVSTMSFD